MGCLLVLNIKRSHADPTLSTYALVAVIVASTLVVEDGLVHKWLNSRLLVWIGTISFSAYVWQSLFLIRPSTTVFPLGRLSAFPLNLVCVFAVSALSYYFIERPCIAQGKRLLEKRRKLKEATIDG